MLGTVAGILTEVTGSLQIVEDIVGRLHGHYPSLLQWLLEGRMLPEPELNSVSGATLRKVAERPKEAAQPWTQSLH